MGNKIYINSHMRIKKRRLLGFMSRYLSFQVRVNRKYFGIPFLLWKEFHYVFIDEISWCKKRDDLIAEYKRNYEIYCRHNNGVLAIDSFFEASGKTSN